VQGFSLARARGGCHLDNCVLTRIRDLSNKCPDPGDQRALFRIYKKQIVFIKIREKELEELKKFPLNRLSVLE
jgi:hypothetical protein